MKLTCPACSARYSLDPERMRGQAVKIRCKRCGEAFRVSPAVESGEVYSPAPKRRGQGADLFAGLASAGAEETPLTGERNESSVLFSLATLAKTAPAPAASVTDSSSLIDLRALSSAMAEEEAKASRADEIANLGGGGAFASGFASPLAAPAWPEPAAPVGSRNRKAPIMIGAIALAAVALVGVAAFTTARARSSLVTTVAPGVANAATSPATSVALGEPSAPAPLAPTTPLAPTALLAPAPSSAAPAAGFAVRAPTHATDARPIASSAPSVATVSTTSAPARCCAGESETVCHMRLSVGAACAAASSTAPSTTAAPPFDRPRAARALAISVASCKRADGPTGAGHVRVTFQPSGSASAVDVEAPFGGTAAGACIAQRYRSVSVPAFSGGALTVGKGFALE